jgi:TFIIH basal transcription factor complex TTD-A subunit
MPVWLLIDTFLCKLVAQRRDQRTDPVPGGWIPLSLHNDESSQRYVSSLLIQCVLTLYRHSFHLVSSVSYKCVDSVMDPCSDPAVKQILLMMNEKKSFIIEDLDNHHLVIKADEEFRVREELNQEVCVSLSLENFWLTSL